MQLDLLINHILDCCDDLIASIQTGESLTNLGLRRSARLPILAALYKKIQSPILLLTDRTDRALTLFDEMALWAPDAAQYFFPEPTPLFYEDSPWGERTRHDRLQVLTNLLAYHMPSVPAPEKPPIIITPARGLMARSMPRREFIKSIQVLKIGQVTQPNALARDLVTLGYIPVNTVISPGQFARRGGILDLWPPPNAQPTRIELFGDEIDTLRYFDPATQRTQSTHERLIVSPAREYLLPVDTDPSPEVEISEFHIPLLHPTAASLLDYLPQTSLVLVDNWDYVKDTVDEVEEQSMGLRADFIETGTLPDDFPLPYITWTEIQDSLSMHRTLKLGPVTSIDQSHLAQKFSPEPRFGGQLKPLLDHITKLRLNDEGVFVVSRQSARLEELWKEHTSRLAIESLDPVFITASLSEGWVFSSESSVGTSRLHLVTDGEIFGWRRPEPRQRHRGIAEAPEAAYADLQTGDWIVHVDHGVGRFLGLVNRTIESVEREYLTIEYAENDQLFVPVYQADRISRYIGSDSRIPNPSRLGGVEWRNTKGRVKEAVKEVAEDLLALYAKRQVASGHAFILDTPWQQELEASFPYIETDDQLQVLNEVKSDMENSRPMDRLICGDVGYGKTEVALRAAFKAVMDGKQVALLVPTTVLAQQHFYTFRERLAAYPVEVEMLSRFRTPQQQREILFRLAKGNLDIVIGTHRLIQGDVEFKDLGLLIIDEEQRFGVTHKEHLKKMRTEVDVLTLTATPIPRTLYMALTGVRDISTINTPPEERLPIITHVGPYSKRLIRQAILREMERGGQVFFVHNRVQTINAMRSHLERLVPESRITIAHGQMPEKDLSERMKQFTAGEVDVLLSTSIIESGLDIPNANTLIVDRADTFGLAQLYQLRGRVGRGAQRAYTYFFKHRRKRPTKDGQQRLETIAENTELGAGFSIAMRDLEIRGTGDILGTRQHGHIAAVGFHLYTRLLSNAVARQRADQGLPPESGPLSGELQQSFVAVDLPIIIGIPPDYVPDKNMRLRLYRRIADTRSLDETMALAEEFRDRFGPLTEDVKNLLYQLKIKILAQRAGLEAIRVENNQLALTFTTDTVPLNMPDLGPQVRLGKTSLWLPYATNPDWREHLIQTLRKLNTPSEE
ncbi:MAG: transcription-repair coupling factor [Anaerolineales bacterium]|nr:transcription-repair coupling factor [Anaerolineales bacterium]